MTTNDKLVQLLVAQCELLLQLHNSAEITLGQHELACIASLQEAIASICDLPGWLDLLFMQEDLLESCRQAVGDDVQCLDLLEEISLHVNRHVDRMILDEN